MINIGVLGAGTWGMALARMLSVDGCGVTVWSALPREVEALAKTRVHPNLPGMAVPDEIVFTGDMAEVCRDKDLLLFAVPSVYVRDTARKAALHIPPNQLIVDVEKGIEPGTLLTLTGVIEDELQKAGNTTCRLVALSGPTHAEEVALDKPTEDPKTVEIVGGNCYIRTAPNTDGKILGVAHKGDTLPYGGQVSDGGWLLVQHNNQNAWVSGKYGKLD